MIKIVSRLIKTFVVKHRRDQFRDKIVNAVPQLNDKVLVLHVTKELLKNRSIPMAARVTVVEKEYNILYDHIFKHETAVIRNSFKRMTGMNDWSCVPGKPLSKVKFELKEVLSDSLIIGFAMDKQFASLELCKFLKSMIFINFMSRRVGTILTRLSH